MTHILFRCDASLSIGSGHVIRCRTLARYLKQRGVSITFLCRRQKGDLISLLQQEFRVLGLPEQSLVTCEGMKGRHLYNAWLGCTQDQDAQDCLRSIRKLNNFSANWLVVDHYGLDACWEEKMLSGLVGRSHTKLLVIDDLADRIHQADLLLDQNFFGENTLERYSGLVPARCRQLLGPRYALLSPEYSQLRPLVPIRKNLRRVLVFFGGEYPLNITCLALEALMDPMLSHLAVDVVLGQHSPHRKLVSEFVDKHPNITLHGELPSLAGLIARADLAIGAGGTSIWERICLGLPSLVVVLESNQLPIVQSLESIGYLQFLGDSRSLTVDQIRSALLAYASRRLIPSIGDCLTDGYGASRLAIAMLGAEGTLSLKSVQLTDKPVFSHCVYESKNDLKIPPSQRNSTLYHLQHSKRVDESNEFVFLVTGLNNCPIGKIKFTHRLNSCQDDINILLMDLSLDHCTEGGKLFCELVRICLHSIESQWRDLFFDDSQFIEMQSKCYFIRAAFDVAHQLSFKPLPHLKASKTISLMPSKITLLSDEGSWINMFLPQLISALWQRGHAVRWIHNSSQLLQGDVCLLLSCGQLLTTDQLKLHYHNLVIHESALPQGQGWSPMTWQILEGLNSIQITLFEAIDDLDAGAIYLQQCVELHGHELVDEWRSLQAKTTFELCLKWFDDYHEVVPDAQPQLGNSTYYRRRSLADSELNPQLSLVDQFNLLRVVDNNRYPAFFNWKNRCYSLQIYDQTPEKK